MPKQPRVGHSVNNGQRTDSRKQLLRRLAAPVPGRLEILGHEKTAAMLEQAVILPVLHPDESSESSGDEGDDSPKPKSPLLGLMQSLTPCCEDEAILKLLRRSTSNNRSAMLAMSCARLNLSPAQTTVSS